MLLWAERLLVSAGVATLVGCALLVGETIVAQRMARTSLERAVLARRPASSSPVPQLPGVGRGQVAVHAGSPIAALSIPRIRLSAVVLHGSDAQTLRRGPGHLENTAFPGEQGNVVIAGHRDSFFAPLRNIARGDDIFLDTPQGPFHYRVTSLRVVNAHDVSVLAATDQAELTLITCYPFWVFGNAPDRFVVRASAVPGSAVLPFAGRVTPRNPIAAPSMGGSRVQPPHEAQTAVVLDDEVLVRERVERYRLVYNARLVGRPDGGSGRPLRFEACDVTLTGDEATAACQARFDSSSGLDRGGRTFTLERAAGEWEIRSIALQ
jgi:sortase A